MKINEEIKMDKQYKDDIRSVYKKIDKDKQKELYNKMKSGDQDARIEIIYCCLPLVYDIAKKFQINNKHIDIDDMIQHGNLALLKAVDNWNPEKSSITTVATYYIRNSLIDMIKDSRYSIKSKYDMTRQAAEDISKIKSVESNDVDEISNQTGLTHKRIRLLKSILNGKRIDLKMINIRLHSEDSRENRVEKSVKGCVADLVSMVEEHIEDKRERDIFLSWISYINQNNKTKIVASENNCTSKEVSESVKKTKKTLRKILSEIDTDA